MTGEANSPRRNQPPALSLMQRACRVRSETVSQPMTLIRVLVPASPPPPCKRPPGRLNPLGRQSVQPTLRLGVVVAGLPSCPQPPRRQARLMTRALPPPAGLLFGSGRAMMRWACWHSWGSIGPARQAISRGAGKPTPSVGCPAVTLRSPWIRFGGVRLPT